MELYVDIKKRLPGFSLDVQFETGIDNVGILGASGSGKSMTLRCIAGIETPDSGRIILNSRVLYDSDKGINLPSRDRKIGFLFQNYALFPNMTVEENIRFGLGALKLGEQLHKVEEMIALVHLEGLEKRYPKQLSGGQQQRVALARALAIEPEALMLDEPFSALDEHLRNHLLKQLTETLSNYKGVTLFVTHNMEEAYRISKELIVLSSGKLEAKGNKEAIFMKPPTLVTAQLTGYKNVSSVKYLSPYEIEALDWGIKLKVNKVPKEDIKHVGIRCHYIDLAKEGDTENVYKCWSNYTSETPFRRTIYLSLERKPLSVDDYQLHWEISKEKWDKIKDMPQPWYIKLNPEKMIFI